MPAYSSPFSLPKYLSQPEVESFFSVIRSDRDLALFGLIYHYGLRVSEASLVEMQDLNLVRHRILVRRVKGGVWGEKPLFRSTEEILRRYLAVREEGGGDALFPGTDGQPLQKRRIQQLFTRYRDSAVISPQATCHWLRHSIATHLLDAGLPIPFVQDHLGHRNPASTAIYARISDRNRERMFAFLDHSSEIVHPHLRRRKNP